MKTDKKVLVDALKKLKGVTAKGGVVTIYHGVLLQNGSMTATNGSYTVKLPVECESEGDVMIMPDAMNLLFNLPDGDVDIELSDKAIKIRGGAVKANFKTLDAAEFIKMNGITDGAVLSANWTELREKLASVLFACAKSNEKPIMKGVHLFTRDGMLNMLGCNGFMLAWEKLDYSTVFNTGENVEIDCVIDCDTLWKLIELCDGEDLRITMDRSKIAFETEQLEMQSRLLDGVYPKVDGFVPEYTNTAMVNMPGLVSMIRRVCALADNVTIDASEDRLSVSCAAEGIEYHEDIELNTSLKTPLRVKFSSKFCNELFNAFKGYEDVEIGFDSGESAAVKPMTIKAGTMVSMLLPVRDEG